MMDQRDQLEQLLDQSPYARLIGMQIDVRDGQLEFHLPFQAHNIGNDQLPALHGGLIGGFMEMAALMHMICIRETDSVPKTVDFSIDYLRPGFARDLMAVCTVTKHGKQVANVQVSAWQESPDKPVAVARAHLLLD
ncbi:PaaI family thioesterase [Limnobacter humi]|uniref:PaaI family thioesterase n=1 Tax=Limnobacter humi TaxID=1778671 RepID=A0ABT1WE48_9BURK|nr:PaaI family thioesterase [Limnobacter humi]MCQ8895796.1 PaaI family thioesterase [Limnobacter humi]